MLKLTENGLERNIWGLTTSKKFYIFTAILYVVSFIIAYFVISLNHL